MNKFSYLRTALLCLGISISSTSLFSQSYRSQTKITVQQGGFFHDIGFDMNFDNREFGDEAFSPSGTIFGSRLTPSVGFARANYNSRHRLTAGVEFIRDFGDVRTDGGSHFKEAFFHYDYERSFEKSTFTLTAGIFPRNRSLGEWGTAFFSEKYLWYNHYMEGMLMGYDMEKGHVELGCDWIGMHGAAEDVKEQFLLFSSGYFNPCRYLKLGYDTYMMHLANSAVAPGVADNFLGEAYAELNLGGVFHEFSLKIGYIQSLQRDREVSSDFETPGLGEASIRLSRGGVGLSNSLYYGKDVMPLYDRRDSAGEVYADRLYFNDPFFRIRTDGSGKAGSYDRLEVFYAPQLGPSLRLKFSAVFHFNNLSYSGCQQMIGLCYNLL